MEVWTCLRGRIECMLHMELRVPTLSPHTKTKRMHLFFQIENSTPCKCFRMPRCLRQLMLWGICQPTLISKAKLKRTSPSRPTNDSSAEMVYNLRQPLTALATMVIGSFTCLGDRLSKCSAIVHLFPASTLFIGRFYMGHTPIAESQNTCT